MRPFQIPIKSDFRFLLLTSWSLMSNQLLDICALQSLPSIQIIVAFHLRWNHKILMACPPPPHIISLKINNFNGSTTSFNHKIEVAPTLIETVTHFVKCYWPLIFWKQHLFRCQRLHYSSNGERENLHLLRKILSSFNRNVRLPFDIASDCRKTTVRVSQSIN